MSTAARAKTTLEELLESLGFVADISEKIQEEQLELLVEAQDSALLIGKKGESLRAIQHLVNAILRKKDPESDYVIVDVAGYRAERLAKLQDIAKEAAEKVRQSGRLVRLRPMNAFERRQIHTILAQDSDLETGSEGEEPRRYIVIRKRERLY